MFQDPTWQRWARFGELVDVEIEHTLVDIRYLSIGANFRQNKAEHNGHEPYYTVYSTDVPDLNWAPMAIGVPDSFDCFKQARDIRGEYV